MRIHIDILGWLEVTWGGLGVLTGVSLVILAVGMHGAALMAGSIGAAELAAVWILVILGIVLGASGTIFISAGRGLHRRRSSSRITTLVLAVPNLVLLPFGTALAIYAFWVLLNNDARDEFGRPLRGAPAEG